MKNALLLKEFSPLKLLTCFFFVRRNFPLFSTQYSNKIAINAHSKVRQNSPNGNEKCPILSAEGTQFIEAPIEVYCVYKIVKANAFKLVFSFISTSNNSNRNNFLLTRRIYVIIQVFKKAETILFSISLLLRILNANIQAPFCASEWNMLSFKNRSFEKAYSSISIYYFYNLANKFTTRNIYRIFQSKLRYKIIWKQIEQHQFLKATRK